MTPVPELLLVAARSGAIRGVPLAVLVELYEWIDTKEFRPVKAWCIAERLHVNRSKVYEALATLTERGYLETGEPLGTARTYRLIEKAARVA